MYLFITRKLFTLDNMFCFYRLIYDIVPNANKILFNFSIIINSFINALMKLIK